MKTMFTLTLIQIAKIVIFQRYVPNSIFLNNNILSCLLKILLYIYYDVIFQLVTAYTGLIQLLQKCFWISISIIHLLLCALLYSFIIKYYILYYLFALVGNFFFLYLKYSTLDMILTYIFCTQIY